MKTVTIETLINKPVNDCWSIWTSPNHIINWNFATPEWHCPSAEHELKVGANFKYHMAAKDGNMAFDYTGSFTSIIPNQLLEYKLNDNRTVSVKFSEVNGSSKIVQTFEVEDENTIDMQRQGWQAILDNFKKYAEST